MTLDWRALAFKTGAGDTDRVLAGIHAAYADAGLAPPARVAWVPSPLHGAIAALLTVAAPVARGMLLDAGLDQHVALVEEELAGCEKPDRPVRDLVRTVPWEAARSVASARLGAAGWARACARYSDLQDQTGTLVAAIRRSLGALGTEPGDSEPDAGAAGPLLRRATLDALLGQHDAAWLAVFSDLDLLDGLSGLAAVAAETGWWWPYEHLVIVSARPEEIHRDDTGRLHRRDGPALAYGGGFELNAWRGMPLPPGFLESLTDGPEARKRIMTEENAELRRVMLECYGFERYLADTGARPLSRDPAGVLWRIPLPGDEPVVMVEVVNSTPEPDGTHRTYWLRVPPDTRTAWQGIAWTFGLDGKDYQPEKQT